MRHLVCFDISNGRRRNSMVKLCKNFGFRVQKSVFEVFMDKSEAEDFETSSERIINPETDSVRIYPLDTYSADELRIVGKGKKIEEVPFRIL